MKRTLADFTGDVMYAVRNFVRTPGFTAVAVVTLALGIGANAALFTVIHAVLLKPLPYTYNSDRIVRLIGHVPSDAASGAPPRRATVGFTAAEAQDIRDQTRAFAEVGTIAPSLMGLSGHDDGGRLQGAHITASMFSLLGARAQLGRVILPEDGSHRPEDVMLLSDATWRRFFGADPQVIGRAITLETVLGPRQARRRTVIGVMPPAFAFPSDRTDFWIPMPSAPQSAGAFRGPFIARLADGVTLETALAEIEPIARAMRKHRAPVRYELVREQDELAAPVKPALLALAGAVAFVLLIACANVTNLLLARALLRRRESAIRVAIGASRFRLVRQALAESLVLAIAGGLGGIVLAIWGVRGLRTIASTVTRIDLAGGVGFPRLDEIEVDLTVVAVTAAIAVLTGVLASVGAAVRHASTDPLELLRGAGGATASRRWLFLSPGRVLVVAQVAAGMVLLVGAGLLVRSFLNLAAVDPGYAPQKVLTFQVSLPSASYPDDRLKLFAEMLRERLAASAGVHAAAYANQVPLVLLRDSFAISRTRTVSGAAGERVDTRLVSRDYFRAMGIPIVAGRAFSERDAATAPRVLVINHALARRLFPNVSPVGLQVYVGTDPQPWQVIGMAADVRQVAVDRPAEPQFFVDLRQWPTGPVFPIGPYFVVRSHGDAAALIPVVRTTVRGVDARAAVFNVTPMDALVANSIARERLYAVLLALLAAVGAVLAAVGVYGLLAYHVNARTVEIGIRLALGAGGGSVLMMVVRHGLGLTVIGIALGLGGAAVLSRYLESLLFEITPLDAPTFFITAATFIGVAALAVYVPARRATRVDPITAIRTD